MTFEPDYRNIVDAAMNKKPQRMPVYEHTFSPKVMETIEGSKFAELAGGGEAEKREYFRNYCGFFKNMTYDTVSYEYCITTILPGNGALQGGKPGPIQSREDFDKYPWDELESMYWGEAKDNFDALEAEMPAGMKAIGGVGNGVFEISEDLVGLEYLAYMQIDDPELFADLYEKIGELMVRIWKQFLDRYAELYAVCRFGDDLGFKSGTLTSPGVIRGHVLPQYKKVIDLIKSYGKPFLWHSCGCIFEIMDDVIALGIDAKHSNEDAIAGFDQWIEKYGARIGLFGGIDVDILCQKQPGEIEQIVYEAGRRFREKANGFALGSGNSIPDYVPADGYAAMIEGAKRVRAS